MLRTLPLCLVIVLTAALHQPYPAIAKQDRCPGMLCRAQGYFTSCDRPLNGAKVFSGRVMGVSKDCSNKIIRLQVDDANANNLPAVIETDLGPCVSFAGKVGDGTQIALAQSPYPDVRRYHHSCGVW